MNRYTELLQKLLEVHLHGMKLGLENCWRLNQLLGCPVKAFPSIHVAGTNGKGSVVTKIAAALQATGKKVGLYTSPHISCFRERIRINGTMISEQDTVHHIERLFSLIESEKIPATFFELTTLMAFNYFAENKIDVAVIETGLGGRLDATNISQTNLAIITSISLEHTEILGSTIESITREKAGIIKPKIPVLIGPRVPEDIVSEIALQYQSPLHTIKGPFNDFFSENEAIAKGALEILNVPKKAIEKGLKVLPPCRLETISLKNKIVIMDVAHNPDGFKNILNAIALRYPNEKIRFVIGLSKNKDIKKCLCLLKERASHFHLVEAAHSRAAPKVLLHDCLIQLGVSQRQISNEHSIGSAVMNAIEAEKKNQELILICGTFFIMQEARQALGIKEVSDPYQLN